jgi:hypothetical protein
MRSFSFSVSSFSVSSKAGPWNGEREPFLLEAKCAGLVEGQLV